MPWLLPSASPWLAELTTVRTQGIAALTASTLPSVEALSTTTADQSPGGGRSWRDRRQPRRSSRELHVHVKKRTMLVAHWGRADRRAPRARCVSDVAERL